ncbi:MAG: alpha/beta hydrolase [Parachlamydiales bacterium]|nr:alpha/beta hydrolase [Parachlamydiales bacterium]
MPKIKVNDIEIFYEFEGSGIPLVIIGGFASTHKSWIDFTEPLKKHFKVLIFDIRGFGDTSATSPPYSIEMMANDTIGLIQALKIEKAYMLGCSMGSAILQRICYEKPALVKKAMLCGTFSKLPYPSQMQFQFIQDLLKQNVEIELVLKISLAWLYSGNFLKNESLVSKVIDLMKKMKIDPLAYEGQAKALENFDSTKWIDKIKTETLIVVGKEDIDTPIYCAEEVLKKIKNSKLKIIDKAAHMLFFEKPIDMLNIMMNFFK